MSKAVQAGKLLLGDGRPKICVPLIGRTKEELVQSAREFDPELFDLVEWRADFFEEVNDFEALKQTASSLHEIFQDKPVLFTIRTSREGGILDISDSDYIRINSFIGTMDGIELIDAEWSRKREVILPVQEAVHAAGKKLILSNHDFEKTPDEQELIRRLEEMDALHGDILKLAVMPKDSIDVLTLLLATAKYGQYSDKPLITMAMGSIGCISRISGAFFGSAVTFGTISSSSAPGQMPAKELRYLLDFLDQSIQGQ